MNIPSNYHHPSTNNYSLFLGNPSFNYFNTFGKRYITLYIDKKFTEKSVVKIKGVPNVLGITREEFHRFIFLLKMANLQQKVSERDIDLPNLLVEIFLRVLIKKKFIIKNINEAEWTPDLVNNLLSTKIEKKKEESLKYVIRETFTILTEKYKTIHYIYWHRKNPNSSLKIEREQNYYIGFTKFYFGTLMEKNRKKGKKDQINNYTLPNKKNGNLKSNNKSITPQFLRRLFKSKVFFNDFMTILDSPFDSTLKKSLRAVLYSDAENKLDSWTNIFEENMSYDSFRKIMIRKVSGSKAKLPWFRVEIESAIDIVKNHIAQIKFRSI